jgi:hypothetical protein
VPQAKLGKWHKDGSGNDAWAIKLKTFKFTVSRKMKTIATRTSDNTENEAFISGHSDAGTLSAHVEQLLLLGLLVRRLAAHGE